MRHEILQYLLDNDTGDFISLNDKLKSLTGNQPISNFKQILGELVEDKVAEIAGDYRKLGATYSGVEQNLDNISVSGKIRPKGKSELKDELIKDKQLELTQKELNKDPGPIKKLLGNIERWLFAKWRKWITIPVFLLIFVLPYIVGFSDNFNKIYSFLENKFSKKHSYPSKEEFDVFNEWVTLVSISNRKNEADSIFKEFKKVYVNSGHETWTDVIYSVRNPKRDGEWFLVIDTYPGESSKEDVQGAIENMWNFAKGDRNLEDNLGHWMNQARPIFYDSTSFVKTYGQIATAD